MIIIVGLGNIGQEYNQTRHNIGFEIVDKLAEDFQTNFKIQPKLQAGIAELNHEGQKIILAKPTTYMNLSGLAVDHLLRNFKASPQNLRIIHDDISLPLGTLRWRSNGSAGGNNGLKSIIESIGAEFWRLKVGVDQPPIEIPTKKWVLSRFQSQDQENLEKTIKTAINSIKQSLEATPSETTIHI